MVEWTLKHNSIFSTTEITRAYYWRSGVRNIDGSVYNAILSLTHFHESKVSAVKLPSITGEMESFKKDGKNKLRYSAYYERKPFNRERAIEIHGLTCVCCRFNFEARYGAAGRGYIQVHQVKPVSDLLEATPIDPKEDLAVLCANCHAMIHKDKENTLTIPKLPALINHTP
jgi:5-methylcytosine-specific restriction protein A